jgi:transposase-like protein
MKSKIWLILEKSDDTRVSGSIESYRDRTGEIYNYDSLVPNYKNLEKDDLVIIRKENEILGLGWVSVITSKKSVKTHKRCPKCKTTDIRIRKDRNPKWKCGRCRFEFTRPNETTTDVTNYTAEISDFSKFDLPPSVSQIKLCALNGDGLKSQNSIMQLDIKKVSELVSICILDNGSLNLKSTLGQGFGLTFEERKAVELRAMEIVRMIYTQNDWTLLDTSSSRPYDFEAIKGNDIRYIEVKGTTGTGASIMLTHGEVKHLYDNPNKCALVIITNIQLENAVDRIIAFGGELFMHLDPWRLVEDRLIPTQYRYSLDD